MCILYTYIFIIYNSYICIIHTYIHTYIYIYIYIYIYAERVKHFWAKMKKKKRLGENRNVNLSIEFG